MKARMAHKLILVLLAVIFTGGVASYAEARKRVKGQHSTTKVPYWKVGEISKELSSACQRGEFRQRKNLNLTIGYIGKTGWGITGIATNQWNLVDVRRLRKPNQTYHFYHQGYSDCRVYIAPTDKRKVRN